jgi:transcriptional regulator with XRE-family HTH domain
MRISFVSSSGGRLFRPGGGFAELTGHHRTYIGFLERGERSPNVETLQRVAQAFGLNASDLLREAGY